MKTPWQRHFSCACVLWMPPGWREAEAKAMKTGVRATVHMVGGDEYTGEWLNDKRHGEPHVVVWILLWLVFEPRPPQVRAST
jgi:hypothetical protein